MNNTKLTYIIIGIIVATLIIASIGYALLTNINVNSNVNTDINTNNNTNDDVGNQDPVRVLSLKPNDTIKSPLEISGEARGIWFFEASFPIRLIDEDGKIITVGIAQAQDEWMTENYVPFKAVLEFTVPTSSSSGTLIFEKDNPSGLPEHAGAFRLPIKFENIDNNKTSKNGCKITGCSGQICWDEEVITTCEFKAEYECFKKAICEKQKDGKCSWTKTPEYESCIENIKNSST